MSPKLDLPNVRISTENSICFGNEIRIDTNITSCPPCEGAVWQKSSDSIEFKEVDVGDPKYYGSEQDPKNPVLVLRKATFDDKLYYRLLTWNKIDKSLSNTVFVNVTGGPPNISICTETNIKNRSVSLICEVLLYENSPLLKEIIWMKNNEVLDIASSGGKYTGGTIRDATLVINDVNKHDAGSYQCKASNALGATLGDVIVLGIPEPQVQGPEKADNGTFNFTAMTNSCPAVFFVQWSKKNNNNDEYIPIDANLEEFIGTSNSFPNPVLVIRNVPLHNHHFKIEAHNFIGIGMKKIPDNSFCPVDNTIDNKENRLAAIFRKKGSSIRFNKLRIHLIKNISELELNSLKESLNVITSMELSTENITTVEGFFTLILKEGILKERNVIMMQCLLESIDRSDLEHKCVDYAIEDKQAACYFKEPKLPEDGYAYVQLHVVDDIEHFTDIDSLVATVAATVGCEKSNIKVVGLHPESSFVIVLSMTESLAQTLGRKDPQDLAGLLKYNVDWFKIDNRIIYITRGNEEKLEVPGRSTGESEDKENIEGQSINKESYQKTKGDYDLELQKRVVVEGNVDEIKSFLSGTCTNLFRKILRRYVPDEYFLTLIQKSKDQVLPLLNVDQKNMLYPEKGSFSVSYNNLDLPLLYILFQTICFMEPHSRGWGKTPDPSDTSMAACIENIMEYFFNTPLCLERSDFDRISKLFEQMEEALRNLEMKSVEKEIESRANKQREKRANKKMEGRPKEERDIFRKGMEIRVKDEMDFFEEKLSQKNKEGTDIFKMGLERGTNEKTEIFKKVMKKSTQEEKDIFGMGMEIEDEIKTKERMSIFEKLMGKSAKEDTDFFKKGMEGRVKGKMERIEKEQILPGKFRDLSISHQLLPFVKRTSSITVNGVKCVNHISCVTSDRLWISDDNRLLQVDSTGHVIQELEIIVTRYSHIGAHSVTEDGDLIFINGDSVQKMTLGGTITTLLKECESLFCIHSSRINGDILVGYRHGVLRCDLRGNHRIQLEEYRIHYPTFITENKNGDIWVSGFVRREVVVMDKSGRRRFNYRGQQESKFYPGGICTDILGQVLVCDLSNSSVHLIDQDGQFLGLLLTREHRLDFPTALCLDDKRNLYVGEEFSNTIRVYKYLQETEDSKSSTVGSKKEL